MKSADLHLHTVYSDSTLEPREVVERSAKAGLSAIAVCDHDTVEGIGPTLEAASGRDLEIIPGIELTAEYDSLEVHILGYFIDYTSKDFLLNMRSLKQNRVDRVIKIVAKLNELGIGMTPQDVFDISGGGTVSRLHIASAMVEAGVVKNTSEAFQKYIGDKGPAFTLGFRFNPQGAIKLIRDFGGVPVLAHPYILGDAKIIDRFIEFGIAGLEVFYPEHSQSQVNYYLKFCKERGLLVTGGSDCHGSVKPDIKIGDIKIDYALVEKLKAESRK